jgi:N-acylglucosamine-6-phosphate 2-epimerase
LKIVREPLALAHSTLWESIKNGLIVSCQAPPKSAMDRPEIMAAIAQTVESAGAIAIRAEGIENVRAIKNVVHIPVIGLVKRRTNDSSVYITPTPADVQALVQVGADIIAFDATDRTRSNGKGLAFFIKEVRALTNIALLGDVDSIESAQVAMELGIEALASTLSGYTDRVVENRPDLELVKKISAILDGPLIAEGGYSTPDEIRDALDLGAWAVCVGTAITNPYLLTQKFLGSGLKIK